MDLQLNALDTDTLDKLRKNFDTEMSNLKEKQLLLEKHERKYNMLINGIPQSATENIKERFMTFMTRDLGIEESKADDTPIANAHRIKSSRVHDPSKPKPPDPILVRFIHYTDKQYVMARGYKLAGTHKRMLDDLPVEMKNIRHKLANIAYDIRNNEKLQTRIRDVGAKMILETRQNNRDTWRQRQVTIPPF